MKPTAKMVRGRPKRCGNLSKWISAWNNHSGFDQPGTALHEAFFQCGAGFFFLSPPSRSLLASAAVCARIRRRAPSSMHCGIDCFALLVSERTPRPRADESIFRQRTEKEADLVSALRLRRRRRSPCPDLCRTLSSRRTDRKQKPENGSIRNCFKTITPFEIETYTGSDGVFRSSRTCRSDGWGYSSLLGG